MKIDFAKRPEKRLWLAIVYIVIYCVFLSILGAVVKYTSKDVSIEFIVLWRNLVGVVCIFAWIMLLSPKRKGITYLKTPEWKLQLIRSLSGLASVFLYFYSLKTLGVADATLFLYTSPIFIPFVALIWHRIALHHEMWWGLAISFIGIGIALNPGKHLVQPAVIFALLSGVTAAIAYVSIRFSHYSEPGDRTLFYNFGIASLIMVVVSLFSLGNTWLTLSMKSFICLLAVGLLALITQTLLTQAAKYAPMRLISPFFYFSVIFGFVLDWWIWGRVPTSQILWGCLLIVIGNVLMLILYPKDDLKFHK